MPDKVIRILQVTDMHLQETPETEMKGVNPEQRFRKTLSAIKQESADLLFLTGDLSHHAPSAYKRLNAYLQTLPYRSYWIPGNHDLVGEMYKYAEQGYGQKVVETGQWRFLLLDSTSNPDGSGGGSLSEPELEFLQGELQEAPVDCHVMIVLHHHPVSVNSAWQDQIMLGNADQFWSIVDSSDQVKAVLFGHVHQHWDIQRGAVKLLSSPATAAQFQSETELPEIVDDTQLCSPAYGVIELSSDGSIRSEIKRLTV